MDMEAENEFGQQSSILAWFCFVHFSVLHWEKVWPGHTGQQSA